jgi:hypothetical protein
MGTLSWADGEWRVENDVTTNDELLTAVPSHLHPRARAQARFVQTVPPLRNNSFQTVFPYYTNELIG